MTDEERALLERAAAAPYGQARAILDSIRPIEPFIGLFQSPTGSIRTARYEHINRVPRVVNSYTLVAVYRLDVDLLSEIQSGEGK